MRMRATFYALRHEPLLTLTQLGLLLQRKCIPQSGNGGCEEIFSPIRANPLLVQTQWRVLIVWVAARHCAHAQIIGLTDDGIETWLCGFVEWEADIVHPAYISSLDRFRLPVPGKECLLC